MFFLKKIKNFIKRFFVDYSKINYMIEESSNKTLDEIERINQNINMLYDKVNNKINDEGILNKEKLDNLKFEIESNCNNNFYKIANEIKYSNSEIQTFVSDKTKKNILVIGFYGAPNLGDELMLETLLEYLEQIENADITVLLADNPEYSLDRFGKVKFLHYPKTLNDYNNLADKFDYFIFGGGAIISDYKYECEKSYQYDLGTILIKLSLRAIAFDKKVFCIGLSARSNLNNKEYLSNLRYIICNSAHFSVRDLYTKKVLEEKLGEDVKNKIEYCNDIVFSNKQINNKLIAQKDQQNNKEKNIGIIWISTGVEDDKLNQILIKINEYAKDCLKGKCTINLIPFYTYLQEDVRFYKKIVEDQYSNLTINIESYPINMKNTIELFSKNDIIIGMRYHSILIAYALGISCIPICYDVNGDYDYKVKYLTEMFNQDEALSYKNLDLEKLVERLDCMINKKNNLYESAKEIEDTSIIQLKNIIEKMQ